MNGPASGVEDSSPGSSIMVLGRSMSSSMNSHAPFDLNHLQMSLASLGQDLTLEEAVRHLQELFAENQELKRVLEDNNKFIRDKHEEWATQRQDQAEELAHRQEQARKLVTQLKEMVAEREARIETLEKEMPGGSATVQNRIAQLEQLVRDQKKQLLDYTQNSSPSSEESVDLQIRHEKEIQEHKQKVAALESKAKDHQKQMQTLNTSVQDLMQLKTSLEAQVTQMKSETVRMAREIESNGGAMCKLQEINERLLAEKRELVALNNQMTMQMQAYKDRGSPIDNENDRDFVVVERDMARGQDMLVGAPAGRQNQESTVPGSGQRRATEDQTVSDLLVQLQEERNRVSGLMAQARDQNSKLAEYERHLTEKESILAATKSQLSNTVTQLTQEHKQTQHSLMKQIDELQKSKHQPGDYTQDVQSLRAQVLSLVSELQESEQKLQAAKSSLDRHKQKCIDLQSKVDATQCDMDTQRTKDDQLIEALRCAISSLEGNLEAEKKEHALKRGKLQDLRKNFDQLCSDYHELLTQYEDFKSQQVGAESEATPSLSYASQRPFQERIDSLTAQVMVAEEALAARDDEIRKLKAEVKKLREDTDSIAVHRAQGKDHQGLHQEVEKLREAVETIPVLKAQAEVYRADFEAEREAREKMVTEREQLQEELQQLQLRNQQLEDEYQTVANDQFTTMQRRHATRTSYGATGGVAHPPTHQPNTEGMANLRHAMTHGCAYPRYAPQGQDTIDGQGNQQQMHRSSSQDRTPGAKGEPSSLQTDGVDGYIRPEEIGRSLFADEVPDAMTCPKCQRSFPDYDSLQIHAVECIDNETQEW